MTIRYKYAQPNWPSNEVVNIMKLDETETSIFPMVDGQPLYEEWKVWVADGGVTEPHDPVPPKDYRVERQARYPHAHEQLDMLYWDMKNGTTFWLDSITKVKTDFPKPAEE